MTTTYKITKGQQYDPNGALVAIKHSAGNGRVYALYAASGTFDGGTFPADADAVQAAVVRVIATGEAETITTGQAERAVMVSRDPETCPHCGSVCYGDCQASS